jgi:hypothetical protein
MAQKVTIKKWNGDDVYSWAVFVNDSVIPGLSGLSRSEAQSWRERIKKDLARKDAS